MTKRIVYQNESGGVSVIVPAPEMFDANSKTRALFPQLKDATEEQILQFIIEREGKAKDFKIIEVSELLPREFRNAWTLDKKQLTYDMKKCREIWLEKMREARKPKLEALDLEYQRADEADDKAKKKEVAAKKQALRDVTADAKIAAAKTPDDLKAVWPEVLK